MNLQPPDKEGPPALPASTALDADITEHEAEPALSKLSNVKNVGAAGRPAELRRYTAHHVTMDNGSCNNF